MLYVLSIVNPSDYFTAIFSTACKFTGVFSRAAFDESAGIRKHPTHGPIIQLLVDVNNQSSIAQLISNFNCLSLCFIRLSRTGFRFLTSGVLRVRRNIKPDTIRQKQ